jgi:hypothetical protein
MNKAKGSRLLFGGIEQHGSAAPVVATMKPYGKTATLHGAVDF